MSSVREQIIDEWSGKSQDRGVWVDSDGPVYLHEPHQRIDNNNERITEYPRGERGFWCEECRAKVTLGPGLETEYGHFEGCEHRNVDRTPSNKAGEL